MDNSGNIKGLTTLVKRYCNSQQIADVVEASEHNLYFCVYLPDKEAIIETTPIGSSNVVSVKNGVNYQVLQSGDYETFAGYFSMWEQ